MQILIGRPSFFLFLSTRVQYNKIWGFSPKGFYPPGFMSVYRAAHHTYVSMEICVGEGKTTCGKPILSHSRIAKKCWHFGNYGILSIWYVVCWHFYLAFCPLAFCLDIPWPSYSRPHACSSNSRSEAKSPYAVGDSRVRTRGTCSGLAAAAARLGSAAAEATATIYAPGSYISYAQRQTFCITDVSTLVSFSI